MNIELLDIMKILTSLLLGLLIGHEREKNDKPCGLRTIAFISLGATITVLISLKWNSLTGNNFDTIRLIAYYLVAIGFVGGGIISRRNGKLEGITTASLLLPVSLIGILCGMGEYTLAVILTFAVYFILHVKYYRINRVQRRNIVRKNK